MELPGRGLARLEARSHCDFRGGEKIGLLGQHQVLLVATPQPFGDPGLAVRTYAPIKAADYLAAKHYTERQTWNSRYLFTVTMTPTRHTS